MKLLHDLAAVLSRLTDADIHKFCVFHEKYRPHFASISAELYDHLDAADQARFVVWFLKRWGKIDVINRDEAGLYLKKIQSVRDEPRPCETLNGTVYHLRDFASQGCDFKLLGYEWVLGVHDVYYNQYEHRNVTLAPGDVIIDAGAFIGDTAVLFRHKLGGHCEIHSFELLDENLALLQHNLERNGAVDGPGKVVINKIALTDVTGGEIVIAPGRSQGATSIFGQDAGGDRVGTVTLDDYVRQNNLPRVDFIKMDIEGAELPALHGARETIRRFKPRLAICLYHKWDDAITIPKFIRSLGVSYSFSFKWVQLIDGWEAVLLAASADGQHPPPAHDAAPSTDSLPATLGALTKAYLKKHAQADALWREKLLAGQSQPATAPVLTGL